MKFPSIKAVASALRDANETYIDAGDWKEGFDVRLQVYPDGDWAVRTGLSDFDSDHRGFWGATCVPGNGKRFNAEDTARNLIDQCRDSHAQSEAK